MPRIYLDNPATSWPKPEAVYRAVERYQRELGAPAGRSVYAEAVEVQAAVEAARWGVARLLGLEAARQVIFTTGGTSALNTALHGLLRPGDHVVTTVAEHNSVLRPLRHWEMTSGVSVTRVTCDARGIVSASAIAEALRPNTRLVAMIHASNVTGALQPVAEVGQLLRDHPARFLVDAAQSLGHLLVDFDSLGCDLLAAPAHKGLLAPLGVGILALRPGIEDELASLQQGGTGTRSELDQQPTTLPDKYEAGNLNVPGILGLGAAVDFLQQRGLEAVRQHELQLTTQLLEGLYRIAGVRCFGPVSAAERVGVVSFQVEGYDPQEVAALLDATHRIQVRAGLHCAPQMHQALSTIASGGTVRVGLSLFTTSAEIETTLGAIAQLAESAL